MTPQATELLSASQRELGLWQELVAIYQDLAVLLRDEQAALDSSRLVAGGERAELVTAELRALREVLGPWRLGDEAVSIEVQSLWRASAALAAEAAAANAQLVAASQARKTALASRLAALDGGRRALAGYRPSASSAGAVAARRA